MFVLTVDMLRGSWQYHAACAPMRRWNLPDAEDVDLRVISSRSTVYANCWLDGVRQWITFNTKMHGSSQTLHQSMAHEMIHWHMDRNRIKDKSDHGPTFQKYALAICKFHGYDYSAFTA